MSIKNFFRKMMPVKVVQIPAPPSVFLEHSPGDGRELPPETFRGQVKLGVIIGHTKGNPGAKMVKPHALHEYAFNTMIAQEMAAYAKRGVPGMLVEIIERDSRGIVAAYDKARASLCDAVIELHFNAHNGKARGSLTLSSPDMSDVDFAHVVHKTLVSLFGREGRIDMGVQTISKSSRGGVNVHSFPGGVNCLVEPFFGDNLEDCALAMDKKGAYARALVDAVQLWARKVDLLKG